MVITKLIGYIFFFTVLLAEVICNEEVASKYLSAYNLRAVRAAQELALTQWEYAAEVNDKREEVLRSVEAVIAKELKKDWEEMHQLPWEKFTNEDLLRQYKRISILGEAALTEQEYTDFAGLVNSMKKIYLNAKIPSYDKKGVFHQLDGGIKYILSTSRNPEELAFVWTEWRRVVAESCKKYFLEYVEKSTFVARANRMMDFGELWLSYYETPHLKDIVKNVWKKVKPFYTHFHAYVRERLREKYGSVVSQKGPIPSHLLGNLWAESWENIFDLTSPFDLSEAPDITSKLVAMNYENRKLFHIADAYMVAMNLNPMPSTFWDRSIFNQKEKTRMLCHPAAVDFYDGKDYRVRTCTKVSYRDFLQVHKLLANIEYAMMYKEQPFVYRTPPNLGFSEGITKFFLTSVQNLEYVKRLKFYDGDVKGYEKTINWLFLNALVAVPEIAHSFVIENWRWNVFSGKYKQIHYNCEYWNLAYQEQGLEPPVDRNESSLDPIASHHITGNLPVIQQFIGTILQFQIFRGICIEIGEYNPKNITKRLHQCNIHGDVDAGNAISEVMSWGASRPWTDGLFVLTGQRSIDISGILEYFEPLIDWLIKHNKQASNYIGWKEANKICKTVKPI